MAEATVADTVNFIRQHLPDTQIFRASESSFDLEFVEL